MKILCFMRQVFNVPNIILIALLAEFVSIAQRHIHEFDVKGDSIGSRPKSEIERVRSVASVQAGNGF